MVHIKRVELSHFKSFGGTTAVPLLNGFTVISGPNGSGKSNILDALLFCLGLASSKGMRAERLPDLVNHNQQSSKTTTEVGVSVTFDLSDWQDPDHFGEAATAAEKAETAADLGDLTPEWTVTRRLRVTKSGSYSSQYFINNEPCNATDLHEQLRRLRVYPEGYNIVLQGDVTRIITMNGRERRQIIDELAGVAEFDRKIEQVRSTLEEVREREERFRLIETELQRGLAKLGGDRRKAEQYQILRQQIQEWQQWEQVLIARSLQQQLQTQEQQYYQGVARLAQGTEQLAALALDLETVQRESDRLQQQVQALGEDQHIALNGQLTTQRLEAQQAAQQAAQLTQALTLSRERQQQLSLEIAELQQRFAEINQTQAQLEGETWQQQQQALTIAQGELSELRGRAEAIAAQSQAWVQQQTALTQQTTALQEILNPQRTAQAQLSERLARAQQAQGEQEAQRTNLTAELAQLGQSPPDLAPLEAQIQALAGLYAQTEAELKLTEETATRLRTEQRDRTRQLDQIEAKANAQKEAQGTYASQVILTANLPGICGLVAQLGQVEPAYHIALETAAGGRLGNIVVEDDQVAAQAIELLKREKAGRATFLPLNKIRPPSSQSLGNLRNATGFIDYAVKLVSCEPRYRPIFAYVFGNTAVFENLQTARPFLGRSRIVTLEGELLESSGALSGGSRASRGTLQFGTVATGESAELTQLRERLADIEDVLQGCERTLTQKRDRLAQLSQELSTARQILATAQLRLEQWQREGDRLHQQQQQLTLQISQTQAAQREAAHRLAELAQTLPVAEAQLLQLQAELAQLETAQTAQAWQDIQQQIRNTETRVTQAQTAIRETEAQLLALETEALRLQERRETAQDRYHQEQAAQASAEAQLLQVQQQQGQLTHAIAATTAALAALDEQLGRVKGERDRTLARRNTLEKRQQSLSWEQEKLVSQQGEREAAIAQLQQEIAAHPLPDPLPDVPDLVSHESNQTVTFATYTDQLAHLQTQIRTAQQRLEAMEPVNMLALVEYEQTEARLTELSEKLTTLAAERTELLLRIETFTTLRLRAFQESFDAVNANFQTIFATLSEGDGYLKLENAADPFSGGLNLVAHPKGKPVQRLSSMSGGEKSLTALSFIFALQRYRPSPFYAFDEVDMFLDGANVERLARMIKSQAEQAQFIVVSLRRPMIESAQRTIGVTQARGAYTQVLGIKL